MGFYSRYILPRLIDSLCSAKEATALRGLSVPSAVGTVLELGIGSGLNLPFYSGNVGRLFGIDPSTELLRLARPKAAHVPFPVEFFNQSADEVPLEDRSVDTVVSTWVMCSIPDLAKVLGE